MYTIIHIFKGTQKVWIYCDVITGHISIEHDKAMVSKREKYMYKHRISDREYRRGNQTWTTQRNWQHRVHKAKKNKTKTQHNMRWTPLSAKKHK